jgi:hypothetical protein
MTDRIRGVRLKIKQSREHIVGVGKMIPLFCESRPYTIETKPHPVAQIHHTTLYLARVQPVPDDIKLVVGDAIHNLRSSLDHLAWQLVEANGGTPSRKTYFPISESYEKYINSVSNGVLEGMSVDAQKLIGDCQRHASKNDTLWVIHELDRIDKHRLLITVVSTMDKWGVDVMKGQTMWFDENRFWPLVPGREIVNIPTSTYSREKPENFKLGIDVGFGETEIAEGELVLPALTKMADFVDSLVNKFEKFLI